jgi:hypothetical protein
VYRRVVGFPGDFSRGITPSSFPRSGASNEARAVHKIEAAVYNLIRITALDATPA